jgi:hypothetical protein
LGNQRKQSDSNVVVTASTTTTIQVCVSRPAVATRPSPSLETHAGNFTYVNQFTGETDAQIQATVTSVSPVYPIDSTSQVVMPSYFGQGVGLTQLQQFLYCTSLPANCGPAAVPAANWFGGHLTADAINFHGKEGGNFPTLAESVLDTWVSAITGILSAADLAKPFYNTEGGYSGAGWTCALYRRRHAGFVRRPHVRLHLLQRHHQPRLVRLGARLERPRILAGEHRLHQHLQLDGRGDVLHLLVGERRLHLHDESARRNRGADHVGREPELLGRSLHDHEPDGAEPDAALFAAHRFDADAAKHLEPHRARRHQARPRRSEVRHGFREIVLQTAATVLALIFVLIVAVVLGLPFSPDE